MQPEGFKHVTNRQGIQFADLARKWNVSRADLDRILKNHFLTAELMSHVDRSWLPDLKADATTRDIKLHLVNSLCVDYTISLLEVAKACTEECYCFDIAKDEEYSRWASKISTRDVVLVNWPEESDWCKKAIKWGTSHGLSLTTAHIPFTIGKIFPGFFPRLMHLRGYDFSEVRASCVSVYETSGFTRNGESFFHCVQYTGRSMLTTSADKLSYIEENAPTCWLAFSK